MDTSRSQSEKAARSPLTGQATPTLGEVDMTAGNRCKPIASRRQKDLAYPRGPPTVAPPVTDKSVG